MSAQRTKQEILDQIAALIGHSGWQVSSGSTEPRVALAEIAESIGVPTSSNDSKRTVARLIVESWGMDWYPTYESAGETITRQGLAAVLDAVILATRQSDTTSQLTSLVSESNTSDVEESRAIKIGQIYRFEDHANANPDLEFVDGEKNWFFYTDARSEDLKALRFQAGIWNPKKVKAEDKCERTPLIFCTTFPDRAGSHDTPWHDQLNIEEGRVLYFGDNKDPSCIDPSLVRGNRIMLENQRLQHSLVRQDRELSSPVLLIKAHGDRGKDYGFRTPIGLGVIWRSDRVSQRGSDSPAMFPNFRFEIILLDLIEDGGSIDMRWIHARRSPDYSSSDANQFAPSAWRTFVEEGIQCLPKLQFRNIMSDL